MPGSSLAALLHTGRYLGSGMTLIDSIFEEGHAYPQDFLLKILFTAVTLGAGFKGGEIVPSLTIGAALALCCHRFSDFPLLLLPPAAWQVCSAASQTCPVTSLLISFELFGLKECLTTLQPLPPATCFPGGTACTGAEDHLLQTETRYINEKSINPFCLKQSFSGLLPGSSGRR